MNTTPLPTPLEIDNALALNVRRGQAAEHAFAHAPLAEVEASGHWTHDGHFWSRRVYWENGDEPSIAGSFGVEFTPGSHEIVDWWW